MTGDEILSYVLKTFEGLTLLYVLGEKGVFYNPGKKLSKGAYFITLKEEAREGEPGRLQVSLCISRQTFQNLFGFPSSEYHKHRPLQREEFDVIQPHPEQGHNSWITVINPTERSFKRLRPLFRESYEMAKQRFDEAWKKKTTAVLRRPS